MTPRRNLLLLALLLLVTMTGCGVAVSDRDLSKPSDSDVIDKTTEKGPIKLTVRVSPKQPRLSDLVEVDAQVTCPAGIEIKPPTFGQATGDFVVRDYVERKGDRPAKSSADGLITQHFRYQLEPLSSGRHLVRAIAIEFVDERPNSEQRGVKSVIESEPIEVNVVSELGDQVPNLSDLEPMLPPRPVENLWTSYWLYGVLAIALIVAVAVWYFWKKETVAPQPVPLTPQEIAHAAFKKLLAEELPARGQFKEFYVRLTGIVRIFIESTTGLHAPEQTTEEFLVAMRSRTVFSANQSVRLQEFLEAADMVKYAGQEPDSTQVELSIVRAKEFVDFRESPDLSPANDLLHKA